MVDSFSNETRCSEMQNSIAAVFGTIFVVEIAQKQEI